MNILQKKMSHLPLDARAILHYLNELGYTNITAVQLKEFLKDLRKLIKYEESVGVNIHHDDYYEGLFRRTTASYRAKVGQENARQKNNGRNYVPPSIKRTDTNLKKQRHLDYKENIPTASVTMSTKCYKELLEENGRRNNSYHKSDNPKIVLENYYHKWQTAKTLKTNNEQKANKNNSNTNIEFNKIKQKKERIDLSSEKMAREIIDEILNKIRTNNMDGKKENGSFTATTASYSRIREMVIEELREQLEKNLHSKLTTAVINERTQKDKRCPSRIGVCFSPASPTLTIKSNSTKIKRLPQAKVKKPYWETMLSHKEENGMEYRDNNTNDKNKMPQYQQVRSKSPTAGSSNASSGRTTNSGSRYRSRSVLVSRSSSSSRRRKPRNSDPVALYQYYKNEWEHFSKQIPGQTNHQQLRWQIKQRLIDSD